MGQPGQVVSMTRSAAFESAFTRIIGHEGRFQMQPGDRGNWTSGIVGKGTLKGTKWGISAMTYPYLDIQALTEEDAREIYWNDWWLTLGMSLFSTYLSYQMLDAAVNHGMGNATRMLQRAVRVLDDGIIGGKTKAAVEAMEAGDLMLRFLAERLEFMTKAGGWEDYGRGWSRRIADNMRYAAEDTP